MQTPSVSHQPQTEESAAMDQATRLALEAHGVDAMREINARLRTALEGAPAESTAEIEVRKTAKGYRGLLKIYSHHRRFVGGSRAENFSEVVDNIFGEVHAQIQDWKKDRFAALESTD